MPDTAYNLSVVTPEGEIFRDQAISVVAPGIDGYIGILAHHQPMLAQIGKGTLKVTDATQTTWFAVQGGIIEVNPEGVVILADICTQAPTEDEAKALLDTPHLEKPKA